MAKPKPKPQLSLHSAHIADDAAGIPDAHWCRLFFRYIYCALDEAMFADMYQDGGRAPISPVLLTAITILQYLFQVGDRLAVDATIMRRDWRIALGLTRDWTGFCPTVLVDFRKRLAGEPIRTGLPAPVKPQIGLIFEQILRIIEQHGLLDGRRKVRTDATKLVANVASLGRADALQEAIRVVVCDLHKHHPNLQQQPEFRQLHETYGEENWLGREGNGPSRLVRLGRDGYRLLQLCGARPAAGKDTLAQMLAENFVLTDDGELMPLANDQIASDHIASPHDPDAKVGKQDRECWIGDKVHLTETADEGQPPFIIDVITTDPRIDDSEMTVALAQRAKQQLPSVATMVVDTGYASAANTTDCAAEGLDLVSRPRPCTSPSKIPPHEFEYDFERQVAHCPEGHASASWRVERHQFAIRFPAKACAACPRRAECTTSSAHGRRVRIGQNYAQLLRDRQRAETDEFAQEYRCRSAIESTISHLVHLCGLRRSRYRGAAKRALHAVFAATALNVRRLLPCLLAENGNAVAPNMA